MTPETARLLQSLSHLATCEEPVSFIDALMVVRLARKVGELEEAHLGQMLILHDRPVLTHGAKDVLGDFLKAYAQRLAQERALANRPIKPTDNGRTARGRVGRALELALDSKVPSRWHLVELRGQADLVDKTPAEAQKTGAAQRLILRAPGLVVLVMEERAAGKTRGPPRRFELRVQVERA